MNLQMYLQTHIFEWIFAVVSLVLSFGYRKISIRLKAEQVKNEATAVGMQALLRDRIIQGYNHYNAKGFCPIYGKENIKKMYDAYHALGGNDVATDIKDKVLDMPTEREEEK